MTLEGHLRSDSAIPAPSRLTSLSSVHGIDSLLTHFLPLAPSIRAQVSDHYTLASLGNGKLRRELGGGLNLQRSLPGTFCPVQFPGCCWECEHLSSSDSPGPGAGKRGLAGQIHLPAISLSKTLLGRGLARFGTACGRGDHRAGKA